MGWKDPFVRAGVDVPAFRKGKDGVYPDIFFRYRRPAPKSIEKQHADLRKETDPEKFIELMQAFVERYLVSWAFKEVVDGDHIRMLNHPILSKIYFLIIQSDPTDPIPPEYLTEGETGSAEGELKK
jgi:hypothetical protein